MALPLVRFHFFLFGRCVRADAAAVFAALLDFGSLRTLPAADAAFLLVTSELRFAITGAPFQKSDLTDSLSMYIKYADYDA